MFDVVPFKKIWGELHGNSGITASIESFVRFMEKRLGASFVYDASRIPFGRSDLVELFEIAEKLRAAGVIRTYLKTYGFPDEPRLYQWHATCATPNRHIAGGVSIEDDRAALTATLAESLERYVWLEMTDYFEEPRRATAGEALTNGNTLDPERFAGYSNAQRRAHKRFTLSKQAAYLWTRGYSWTSKRPVWVPAQVVSGKYGGSNFCGQAVEPIIIAPITTGLATGPTREFALLNGALEVIERDAFMITWLNQLTPHRFNITALRAESKNLDWLLAACSRYRLRVDALRLPTDAPTYAVCAVVHDESGAAPSVTVGLKAHRNSARAIEGALLEALRMRQNVRLRPPFGDQPKEKIVHLERTSYWAEGERYKDLAFLTKGEIRSFEERWEKDTEREHLQRIIDWCRSRTYEFASVALTRSKKNVTSWHIEMVVIPELIPMHLNERFPYTNGARLKTVPKQFGFAALPEAYLERPHPFA